MFQKSNLWVLLCAFALSATACNASADSSIPASVSSEIPAVSSENEPKTDSEANQSDETIVPPENTASAFDVTSVPAYSGQASIAINQNVPFFTEEELQNASDTVANGTHLFGDGDVQYSELDAYGRCQTATALLSQDIMPSENQESDAIGMINPAGWHAVRYPDVISDLYLYNRCYLIDWDLCAESATPENLTAGTSYLTKEGLLPFENETADYIKETGNHVLYRVTPIFEDENLVCAGILMEAKSIEDDGLSFCVYCYNVQPYIYIDYLTGESYQTAVEIPDSQEESVSIGEQTPEQNFDIYKTTVPADASGEEKDYVLNSNSMKIHKPDCSTVQGTPEENLQSVHADINTLFAEGYKKCKLCNPD